MKLFKIVTSSIRRRKSGAFTFLVMTFISAFMLCIALSLTIGISTFYETKHKELKGSHYMSLGPRDSMTQFTDEQIKNSKYIKKWSQKQAYTLEANLTGTSKNKNTFLLLNANDFKNSAIMPLKYINPDKKIPDHAIILPLRFQSQGIQIGDQVKFKSSRTTYTFQVYAFFEDPELGSSTTSIDKLFVFNDSFTSFKGQTDFMDAGYLTVQLHDLDDLTNFKKSMNVPTGLTPVSYETFKLASNTFIQIISLVLLLFSALVLCVALIVVRFNITTSIAEDITVLGSLKSIGFTNRQLIFAQLLQYGLLASSGCLIGLTASIISFPHIGNVIAKTSGLIWSSDISWGTMLLSIFLIVLLCEGIILLLAQKTRKVTPINALRQGESHHNFKRNPFPLSKLKLGLHPQLALKSLFRGFRMQVTLLIVIASLCLVSAISLVLNYNIDHPKAFYDMIGMENSDYLFTIFGGEIKDIRTKIIQDEEVAENVSYALAPLTINDIGADGFIYEDFQKSTAKDLYAGRKPSADNEIAIGTSVSSEIQKTIGDTVSVEAFGHEQEYIIVGLVQGLSNAGRSVLVTYDGMLKHNPDLELNSIAVTLKDGTDSNAFEHKMKQYEANVMISDISELMEGIFSSMESGMKITVSTMLIASAFIISLILFLMINGMIRREKKTFGTMKACGYTNWQILLQTLLSYLPAISIGSILGGVCTTLFTNNLLSVMFRAAGLNKTFFVVPVFQNIWVCLLLFFLSNIVILLVGSRIRKISPHKLIVAQ